MKKSIPVILLGIVILLGAIATPLISQQTESAGKSGAKKTAAAKKPKRKGKPKASKLPVISPIAELNSTKSQEDFPAMCLNDAGQPIIVYIEHDGEADTLKLAGVNEAGKMVSIAKVSEPGIDNIYQPCLTKLPSGRMLCVWSQQEKDGQWDLMARVIGRKGLAAIGDPIRLTTGAGNDIFADLGTDRQGRVWVTWQKLENGINRVMARNLAPDAKKWSAPIQVTEGKKGGDWEPRLAFGEKDEALIVFDSYRNGNFDIFLARVSPDGTVSETITVSDSERYEARAEAATSPDGKMLWVTYEDGMKLWGKDLGSDWRKKGGGLHHDRQIKVIKIDLTSGEIEKHSDITALLPDLVADPQSVGTGAIDVPEIIVDSEGHPWIFFRYCLMQSKGFWQIAYSKLDPENGEWTKPEVLGKSSFCLDRRSSVALHPKDGTLKVAYASDLRTSKQAGNSGVFLASIDPNAERESAGALPFDLVQEAPSLLKPYNNTPERDRSEHHVWEINGEKYTLRWGDVHRHTDFSNCRTTDDGCITEHFRYAIEAGGLDFLGTSDHTDIGKTYSPYEWWQTQKLADLFHNPGAFVSLYAYEREQKYPYGHRNVLFLERGGPIIYIKRNKYSASRWATPLPPQAGEILGDITPQQLWELLRVHGQRAITIEHTSAGGMGTDWSKYEKLDSEFENILEVFQGSRDSSEGEGAPQPPIVVGGPQISKFSEKSGKGTWQKALELQHRLGAFASSDHRSTNISYGGVYVKQFDREGVFDAMDARRTCAATDKIFMEFSCNGHLMGEIFETKEKPTFQMLVIGTAPISRVTLIRNEKDFKIFEPEGDSAEFKASFTDESPIKGENRYYLRIEQVDGNMGWTSPLWVTFE